VGAAGGIGIGIGMGGKRGREAVPRRIAILGCTVVYKYIISGHIRDDPSSSDDGQKVQMLVCVDMPLYAIGHRYIPRQIRSHPGMRKYADPLICMSSSVTICFFGGVGKNHIGYY
jgi:hypothetical protein